MLRKIVRDRVPGRLRSDENMPLRADVRRIDERSHCDVNESAVAHDGVEQGPAGFAVRVVVPVAENKEIVVSFDDRKPVPCNAGEGLESRARRAPAIGAMAVHRVFESIHHFVDDRAAQASPCEVARGGGHGSNFRSRAFTRPTTVSFTGVGTLSVRPRRGIDPLMASISHRRPSM